jgi:hypothetical protein
MQSRINYATAALAVLWIVIGVVFGGLGFVSAAPVQQTAHAVGDGISETTVHPPAPAHG